MLKIDIALEISRYPCSYSCLKHIFSSTSQMKRLYTSESSTADYSLENDRVIEDSEPPAGSNSQTPSCIPLTPCSLLCAISSVISARNLPPDLHPPGCLTWLRCCGQGGADPHTWAQVPNLRPKAIKHHVPALQVRSAHVIANKEENMFA